MSGPLSGVRVVDLTSVVMGPLATQVLGDMGADVVKVEPVGGDVFRSVQPSRSPKMGAPFLNFNRNKRSIALDLKIPAHKQELLNLLEHADVLVFNLRPQSMAGLGLSYEDVRHINARLIYCGAYGFSEKGPYAGKPALDDIIQAVSGLADLQSGQSGSPTYVNSILADKIAGLTVVYSVAMALYERERSGTGQAIEVPMFETMAAFNLMEHMAGKTFRPALGPVGYDRLLSKWRRPYPTQDGFIAVMPYTAGQWERFFAASGQPAQATAALYQEAEARSRNIDVLYGLVADLVRKRTTAEWLTLLREADVPHSEVLSLDDLFEDQHLETIGFFSEQTHPTEGDVTVVNVPVSFSRTPGSIRRLAPALGADCAGNILDEWSSTGNRYANQ